MKWLIIIREEFLILTICKIRKKCLIYPIWYPLVYQFLLPFYLNRIYRFAYNSVSRTFYWSMHFFKISNHCGGGVTLFRLQRLSSTIAAVRQNFYLEYIVHDNTCQILSHIYCRLNLSYYLKDFFGRNMDVTLQKF